MKKKSISIISLAVCLALLIACFGCSKLETESVPLPKEKIFPKNVESSLHYCSPDGFEEIDTSGLITLLYDESSSAVGVRVTNTQDSNLWSALPVSSSGTGDCSEADIVSLEVIHNKKVYCLNSQDNSVSFGGVYSKATDDGFVVTYLITDSGTWLGNIDLGATDEAYSTAANGNILYKVTVTYSLRDGCFYADIDWKNLGDSSDVLLNIGFLEYFGASDIASDGDYILVPDGSGAIINTASSEAVEPVDIAVYGNDISGSSSMSSVVPAYGMKSGNYAFAAVIEHGDAVSRITANKAKNSSDYNRVGPVFTVSQSIAEGDKLYYSEFAYNDGATVCFRFLSGSNANYAGMAAACREQLIRDHTLSNRSVEVTEYLPVVVNVIGAAAHDKFLASNKKLTEFSEAIDILGRIKAKGINNAYLRYTGALKGGVDEKNASDATPLDSLGGMSGVRELDNYAASLNFSVFYDLALLSDTASGSSSINTVNGNKHKVKTTDILTSAGFPAKNSDRYFLSPSSLKDTVLDVLKRFNDLDSSGYCITDAGLYAYTDLADKIDRQASIKTIAEEIAPLSTNSKIMIKGGNFYSLKNADIISELPMKCSREETESYVSVPFVQIILHGIVEFSYDGINQMSDSKTAILRCVEYGAVPGCVVTNNAFSQDEQYTSKFGIDSWLNTSVFDTYSEISGVLNDLRGSRITNHYMVSSGVYCTEYESTTRIYVNYTQEPVTVSGITVEPMSFFRVN